MDPDPIDVVVYLLLMVAVLVGAIWSGRKIGDLEDAYRKFSPFGLIFSVCAVLEVVLILIPVMYWMQLLD